MLVTATALTTTPLVSISCLVSALSSHHFKTCFAYIAPGPEEEITSISKRDGSHWEVFNCDNHGGEKRQTVKLVCTDSSEDSNCNTIFKGGVQHTVVDMPSNCGPGRYAVAVSLEPSVYHEHLKKHLVKRGLDAAPIYNFTFDYNFGVFEMRADPSKVLLRIDYSDDPGYWSEIVCKLNNFYTPSARSNTLNARAAAHHGKKKRDLEVEERFGGDHKQWLYHTWHTEKRSMNHEELHARWWSGDVREWFDKHRKVDQEYTGVRHRVIVSPPLLSKPNVPNLTILQDSPELPLFDEEIQCDDRPGSKMEFKAFAKLAVDIDTAAGITVIGTLGNLKSFEESSAWFRTRGRVDASLHFNAKGTLSFHTGPVEFFGTHNFGASFLVPGIVTIGYVHGLSSPSVHFLFSR